MRNVAVCVLCYALVYLLAPAIGVEDKVDELILTSTTDPFSSLTYSELRSRWSEPPQINKAAIEKAWTHQVDIEVVIVRTNQSSSLSKRALSKLLSSRGYKLAHSTADAVRWGFKPVYTVTEVGKDFLFSVQTRRSWTTQVDMARPISTSDINQELAKEYQRNRSGYVIYVLDMPGSEPHTFSITGSDCKTGMDINDQGDERFIWFDISTNKTTYGPRNFGTGRQGLATLPEGFDSRTDVELATVELASFIERSTELVLWQVLKRTQQHHEDIHVFHLHSERSVISPFDVVVQKLFNKLKEVMPHMKVPNLSSSDVVLDEDTWISSAVAHSMRGEGAAFILESGMLHKHIKKYLERKGISDDGVKVFILDVNALPRHLMGFENHKQVVSVGNIIMALYDTKSRANYLFSCDTNPVNQVWDSSAIVQQLLDTMFALPAVYDEWDASRGEWTTDYAWAITNQVYSPFITRSREDQEKVSFVVLDGIQRNQVYSEALTQMNKTIRLFNVFEEYKQDISHALTAHEYLLLSQRWNLFIYKMKKVGDELSVLHFDRSLAYAKSMAYDLDAINGLIETAGKRFDTKMFCDDGGDSSWSWETIIGFISLIISIILGISIRRFLEFDWTSDQKID